MKALTRAKLKVFFATILGKKLYLRSILHDMAGFHSASVPLSLDECEAFLAWCEGEEPSMFAFLMDIDRPGMAATLQRGLYWYEAWIHDMTS